MQLMTVTATTNKTAIDIKSNDLYTLGLVDYRENLLFLSAIRNIILEDEYTGININHADGYKINLKLSYFSKFNGKDVAPFGNSELQTADDLLQEFKIMMNL